jgi:hypothetical protein
MFYIHNSRQVFAKALGKNVPLVGFEPPPLKVISPKFTPDPLLCQFKSQFWE